MVCAEFQAREKNAIKCAKTFVIILNVPKTVMKSYNKHKTTFEMSLLNELKKILKESSRLRMNKELTIDISICEILIVYMTSGGLSSYIREFFFSMKVAFLDEVLLYAICSTVLRII